MYFRTQKEKNFWIRILFHIIISILIFTNSLFTYEQEAATFFKEIINFVAGVIVTTIVSGISYVGIAMIFVFLNEIGIKNWFVGLIDIYENDSHYSWLVWILIFILNGIITNFLWGAFIFGVN